MGVLQKGWVKGLPCSLPIIAISAVFMVQVRHMSPRPYAVDVVTLDVCAAVLLFPHARSI
jgi:hypothetical protein